MIFYKISDILCVVFLTTPLLIQVTEGKFYISVSLSSRPAGFNASELRGPILREDFLPGNSTQVIVLLKHCFLFYLGSKAEFVTCGTILKIMNVDLRLRLHSHDVKYGSGSGQQSVTAVDVTDDTNSHWLVRAPMGESCKRGYNEHAVFIMLLCFSWVAFKFSFSSH